MEDVMSPRSPKDRREDDMQDKVLHAVHDALNEVHVPEKPTVPLDAGATGEAAKPAQPVETEVELDRVAIYFKGPTAFSA
jgi:hypothetical protein